MQAAALYVASQSREESWRPKPSFVNQDALLLCCRLCPFCPDPDQSRQMPLSYVGENIIVLGVHTCTCNLRSSGCVASVLSFVSFLPWSWPIPSDAFELCIGENIILMGVHTCTCNLHSSEYVASVLSFVSFFPWSWWIPADAFELCREKYYFNGGSQFTPAPVTFINQDALLLCCHLCPSFPWSCPGL